MIWWPRITVVGAAWCELVGWGCCRGTLGAGHASVAVGGHVGRAPSSMKCCMYQVLKAHGACYMLVLTGLCVCY
jgi:hypothetical protein